MEEFYGQIDGSLSNTLVSNGENYRLVAELMDILMWDIPFTSVQPGDSFKLILEKKYRGGQFVKYGRILAVEFRRGEKNFYAFLFNDPKTGKPRYYDLEGKSVRKAFPRSRSASIRESRPDSLIPDTTRSSNAAGRIWESISGPRLEPRCWLPPGAPWFSREGTGDTEDGPNPPHQRSHDQLRSPLENQRQSRAGGRPDGRGRPRRVVRLSTGPHLDYRVQDARGRFLNPMNLVSLPSEEPIARQYVKDFEKIQNTFRVRLAAIPKHQPYFSRIAAGG